MKLFLAILFLPIFSFAESQIEVMSFIQWKSSQEVEAKNHVVRLSNQLLLLKSEKYNTRNVLPEVAMYEKDEAPPQTEEDNKEKLTATEKQLQDALERLEFTKDLTLADYFVVYLNQFKGSDDKLTTVAEKFKSDEIVQLMKMVLGERSQSLGPDIPRLEGERSELSKIEERGTSPKL